MHRNPVSFSYEFTSVYYEYVTWNCISEKFSWEHWRLLCHLVMFFSPRGPLFSSSLVHGTLLTV